MSREVKKLPQMVYRPVLGLIGVRCCNIAPLPPSRSVLDGGVAEDSGIFLNGGSPSGSGNNLVFNGGSPSGSGSVLNGGTPFGFRPRIDGGNVSGSGIGALFDGGSPV